MTSAAATSESAVYLSDVGERPGGVRSRAWMLVVGGWTLYAVAYSVLWEVTSDVAGAWRWIIPVSIGQSLAWGALTPAIVWVTRAADPERVGRFRTFGAHAIMALACATVVTVARMYALSIFWSPEPGRLLATLLYWLDVHLLTYLMVVVVTRSLDLHRRYRDRTARTQRLSLQLSRAQLQFLELQLQPHFLFNCLNAVSELAHEAPDAAESMLRQLHSLLRVSLERAGQDEVTLEEELAGLEPYIGIQRTRFSDWLTVDQRIDPAALGALVPHLILQPLVENAIRHGLSVRSAPGRIEVGAVVVGDMLRLWVQDDGVGLSPTRATSRRGIGLQNARERLRQLYEPTYRFVLRAAPGGGTLVEIDVPFRLRDELGEPGAPHIASTGEWAARRPPEWSAGRVLSSSSSRRGHLQLVGDEAAVAPTPSRGVPIVAEPPAGGQTWYSTPSERPTPAVTPSVEHTPPSDSPVALSPRSWLGIAAFWGAWGILWSQQVYLFAMARGMSDEVSRPMLMATELTSAFIWALLTPVVLIAARKLRMGRDTWPQRLPVHMIAAMFISALHVELMMLSGRIEPLPLISPEHSNPLTGNVFIYFAIVAWSHGRDFYAWYREREHAGFRLEGAIAKSRFQALCVQLRPNFLLGTLELLTRMVHEDVPRAERLITRLADVLRLTLDASALGETTLRHELDLLKSYVDVYNYGIHPGARLSMRVVPETLMLPVPKRVLRAIVDDLLASATARGETDVEISIETEEGVGETRIRVHAAAGAVTRATPAVVQPWQESLQIAEWAEAEGGVSLFFPDSTTAVVAIVDPRAGTRVRGDSPLVISAQPA